MSSASATRVIVGLSGGVDSAVAALLLCEAGYDVHGLYMNNWDADDAYCTAARDYQDARAVAKELGIVLHRVNFAREYRQQVFEYLLAEYRCGRTPNPDVLCNRHIKFGVCLDYAARLGGSLFATGHYARSINSGDGTGLFQPLDRAKDQTYFLHSIARDCLPRLLFPLGELTKPEVRERARRAGFGVHDKPDSTGICFIGERPFTEFLSRYIAPNPGPIEDLDGNVLGQHRGLAFYTLGQRAGLAIGGARGHAEEPWYVALKDQPRNTLVVLQRHQQHRLNAVAVTTAPLNWLVGPRGGSFGAQVRLRHRQPEQSARVQIDAHGAARIDF